MSGAPEYKSWHMMKQRCSNKNHTKYPTYGGVGIGYEKSWDSFSSFFKDMGVRPEGKTLDRINNSEGYSKENCRWATIQEQQNNRSCNAWVKYKGKQYTLGQLTRKFSFKDGVLRGRIVNNGWSVEKAVNTPQRVYNV